MAYSFRFERPKQAGTLVKEKVRCGKAHCFCSKGERFHEGYALYYRDYPHGGKLKKKYVPKAEVWRERFMMEVAKLADKFPILTLQQKLVRMHKALSEEYDYEADWRTWVLRSNDFTLEQKWKVMHDVPLIDYSKPPYCWQAAGYLMPQENGNFLLKFPGID